VVISTRIKFSTTFYAYISLLDKCYGKRYVIIIAEKINLLNAKLNPSCKSQLAEFF